VPVPYDLFWKVRNVGPAATRKGQERGEIVRDAGRQWKDERTSFSGEHYVEAYVIKNGVCMAQDRIQVPIESQ
jgi:ABC-type branched-subunit amino acid transport system substrate-binding protein